jgi:hypothetical protein
VHDASFGVCPSIFWIFWIFYILSLTVELAFVLIMDRERVFMGCPGLRSSSTRASTQLHQRNVLFAMLLASRKS